MKLSLRTKELFKNTFLFAISNFASKLLVFLMIPLYTSVLSPEDYGLVDVISTTVLLLLPIFTLAIAEAVLRFCLSDRDNVKEYFAIGSTVTLIGSIMVFILTVLIIWLFDLNKYFLFVPVLFLLQSFAKLFGRFARGVDKVKQVAIGGVLETFSIVAFNLFFLLVLKIGLLGYLLSITIGYGVLCLYLFSSCHIYKYVAIKSYKKTYWIESYKYSVPLIPNQLCWWLIDSSSKYILTFFAGFASVGIYTAAFKLPTILNVISSFFIDAWLLSVVKGYEQSDIKEYIRKVYGYFSFLIIFVTLLVVCLCKDIAFLFLRGNFYEGWIYIPLMCLTAGVGGLFAFFATIFSSEKKTYLNLYSTIAGAIVVVLMSVLLVPQINVMGIVVATLVGYIVIWIICYVLTERIIHWQMSWVKFVFEILIIALAIFAAMNNIFYLCYFCLLAYVLFNREKISGIVSIIKRQ